MDKIKRYLAKGLKKKEVAKLVAEEFGVSKRNVYQEALKLTD